MDKRGKAAFFSDDDFTIEEPEVESTPVNETPVVEEKAPPAKTQTRGSAGNPLADMIEKKEVGKACGFYLSPGSIKKLEKAAKELKCSKSKALDLLIQKYL